jgi:hypothetical protein
MARRLSTKWFCVLAFLVAWVFTGCGGSSLRQISEPVPPFAGQASGNGRKVVTLVIDGLRYTESFGDSTTSHIPRLAGELRPQGTLLEDFRNEGITKTNPGHAAIVTGTWQDVANDGSERPDRPTIFEYFRKHYSAPAEDAWFVSGKAKLAMCSYGTDPDYGASYGATENVGDWQDQVVIDTVLAVLGRTHPTVLVANLPGVDEAAHAGEWEDYLSAIEAADSLVLEVWSALQSDAFYAGSTYLFVTDDHGLHDDAHGGFQTHGCSCEGCEHVMLLALGPDVAPGRTVTNTYTLRDLVSTVGEIMDCPVPKSEGVVITEMFVGRLTGLPGGHP